VDIGENSDEWARDWRKRFVRRVFGIALCHYLAWLVLGGLLFLFAALPVEGAVDWIILPLTDLRSWIGFPRGFWRSLWFSEYTPRFLNFFVAILTSLSWGLVYAIWKFLRVDGPLLRTVNDK
tara:strand:+ start:1638 stop:2003 length:366 start_codon:yes stop_codon:yes gene_type:complete